jgi:RNAse (barnase) inhibitor barstar
MKPYLVTYEFYYDNQLQKSRCHTQLREFPLEEEYSGADFDSLWDFLSEW